MKKNIFNFFIIISCSVLLIEILINKQIVFSSISYSLEIFITSIIPSLFPFFVISDILISYHITNYIPKIINKTFCSAFNCSNASMMVFFLSLLSGFPSNARNIKNLYINKLITKEEASHTLIFTHFSSPLFILSTVAVLFLHNEIFGYIILGSHILGNVILGIITRNYNSISNIDYTPNSSVCQNFSTVLIKSIKSAIDTLLLILGSLTCFLVLSSLIIENFNLGNYPSMLIKGILEITMGLQNLATLNISNCYKVVISTMFISFGGLAVHLQVLSQLVDTDIPYQPFFVARIFHALISGGLSYILFNIFF